ncbi:ras guanine nucleotide exchange factor domain-containing protein [Globomyces pollinis-pini]|nr:ras guanine nucleotide exchange factor domain-containing protein [Globomyces pollinis-pini]
MEVSNLPTLSVLENPESYKTNYHYKDTDGNSPLHILATQSLPIIQSYVNEGHDMFAKNHLNQYPIDLVKDNDVKTYLDNKMKSFRNLRAIKVEQLKELKSQLPLDVDELQSLCMDLLIHHNVFSKRCMVEIKDLIKYKHELLHKNRLLEKSIGITGSVSDTDNYLKHIQYWKDQVEKQTETINNLKSRLKELEQDLVENQNYFKEAIQEQSKLHQEQLQNLEKQAEETQSVFLSFQRRHSNEIINAKQLQVEIELLKNVKSPDSKLTTEEQLKAEIIFLRKKLAEFEFEKDTLNENKKIAQHLDTVKSRLMVNQLAPPKSKSISELNDIRNSTSSNVSKDVRSSIATTYTLNSKDDELVLVKSENGQVVVKHGVIKKLIDRLLDPTTYDNQFMQTFMLTYKSFIKPLDLIDFIIRKCKTGSIVEDSTVIVPSPPLTLKCVNLLKYWCDQYWTDFQMDSELFKKLDDFINTLENVKLAQMLRNLVNRKQTGVEAPVIDMPTDCPKPILPKSLIKRLADFPKDKVRPESIYWTPFVRRANDESNTFRLKLAELDPLEVARQLTLIEHELFTSIKPRELVGLAWMKDDKEILAPNIIRMVRWSNHIIQWLVTEIVTLKDNPKLRIAMVEKIITIAKHCFTLNNFNGIKEILAALQTSSVYRLKKTKEAIQPKYQKTLDELNTLTATEMNYKNLRAKIHAVEPPLIPFPGVYQSDLVFLEGCGKDIDDQSRINFQKFQKIAAYIIELQTYQKVAYHLENVPEIQDMIKEYPGLDEDSAYSLSLICEPRNTQ